MKLLDKFTNGEVITIDELRERVKGIEELEKMIKGTNTILRDPCTVKVTFFKQYNETFIDVYPADYNVYKDHYLFIALDSDGNLKDTYYDCSDYVLCGGPV